MTGADLNSRSGRRVGIGEVLLTQLEKKYVNEALEANRLSYGPFSRRFEAAFARAHTVRHAILTNSGTSALHIALLALKENYGWDDGDEVLVPAVTFPATVNAVMMSGLMPVFIDVDRYSYTMTPELIDPSITLRTRAVIPVHLCGLAADMQSVMEICRRRGLQVIEDACEATFARVDGRPVGGFGDVGCFSMQAAHIIVTGVGGMAVTDDEYLATIMRSLCSHGRDPVYLSIDDSNSGSDGYLRTVMDGRFRFIRRGASYRITELEAAIGVAQLERRAELLAARAHNAAFLTDGLQELQEAGLLQLPSVPNGRNHVFMLYPLTLTADHVHRDDMTHLLERRGIETRPLMPLVNQPVYEELFANASLPVARWLSERAFCVGCHPGLSPDDLEYVINSIKYFLRA